MGMFGLPGGCTLLVNLPAAQVERLVAGRREPKLQHGRIPAESLAERACARRAVGADHHPVLEVPGLGFQPVAEVRDREPVRGDNGPGTVGDGGLRAGVRGVNRDGDAAARQLRILDLLILLPGEHHLAPGRHVHGVLTDPAERRIAKSNDDELHREDDGGFIPADGRAGAGDLWGLVR